MTGEQGSVEPGPLVSTAWVAAHRDDPGVRLVEVDVDTEAYDQGHVPGAVGWNWRRQLQAPVRRDIPTPEAFQVLLEASGITPDHHVVLYGDHNNWFAAYAYWLLQLYRHPRVSLMDGGRKKWVAEGRPLTGQRPGPQATRYPVPEPDLSLRARRQEVRAALDGDVRLVDVRSPAEFRGELLAPEGLGETAQRAGHIPGARNIVWSEAVNEDGTFKAPAALRELYASRGVEAGAEVITYCRIGERSAHSWFVLRELLGHPQVRNYDGSWTEWGSMVGNPIERGD